MSTQKDPPVTHELLGVGWGLDTERKNNVYWENSGVENECTKVMVF